MTGRQVEVVRDADRAAALAAEWEELADAAGAGALVRPGYALPWWEHLGRGRLLVVAVRDGGRLVALAPLHERRVGPVTVARWLGHGLGTVSEVVVRPGHEDAAAAAWAALSSPRRVLDLVESRADAPSLTWLADGPAGPSGPRTSVTPRDRCPTMHLDGPDGLAHLARPGTKNLRRVLRRADAALAAAGLDLEVDVATDRAGLEALLPDVRAVFDAAEAATPRQHLLAPPYDGFVLAYLRGEADAGRGVTLVGRIGGRPAAFMLAVRVRQEVPTLASWISRYDPAFAEHSPGHLMLRETFRWAGAHGVRRVDQLLGVSQTKRQWADDAYATADVRHATPAASTVVDAAESVAGRVRRLRERR